MVKVELKVFPYERRDVFSNKMTVYGLSTKFDDFLLVFIGSSMVLDPVLSKPLSY